jgi:hypothetical protein
MVKENRNVSGNEIKMTLEDYFALDNGWYKCGMIGLKITYKLFVKRL